MDGSQLYGERHNLYNGNIGLMVNTITNPSNMSAVSVGNAYVYDQLNRISESRSFANLNSGTNTWEAGSTYNGMYENNFTYDGNGNIERQLRSDEGGAIIDSLTYKYENGQYGRKRNRLYHVKDNVSDGEHEDDIDDMGLYTSDAASIATANNYRYDALGQLVYDRQEEISEIRWRKDGKIDAIIREGSSLEKDLGFTYDPSGNRLSKSIYGPGGAEYVNYYIRDAEGNVMAMYKMKYDADNQTASYSVAERHIYGSDRLGMYAHEETVYPLTPASRVPFQPLWRGHRQYELKNHLGNVTSVVNGHKVAVESTGVIDHYDAQIVAAYDYSPFGVIRKSFEPDYTPETNGDTNPLAADFRWCMDGGGTEANGTGQDATLYSITNTANRNGEAAKALRSNGASGSYMEIADDASLDFGSNDFTVGIWVRKEAAPTSTVNVIAVGKWNTDAQMATNEWCLNVARSSGTARPPQFRISVGGTVYTAQGNSTLSNSWHHLVGVREGTNIKFYINGTLVQTTSVGTGAVNNVGRKIRIGRSDGPLRTRARFDEFVVYRHALTASEIGDLYAATCEDLEGLPSEEIAGAGYSYGFNGKEKDDEMKGSGNHYTTEFRQYDPRIGRWFSIDPAMMQFPDQSPYNFCFNNPIFWNDVDGDCPNGDCNENDLNKAEDLVRGSFNSDTPNNDASIKSIAKDLQNSVNAMFSERTDSEGNSMLNSADHIAFENLVLDIFEEKVHLDRYAPDIAFAFESAIDDAQSVGERADLIASRSLEVYNRNQMFALEGLILDAYGAAASGGYGASSVTPRTPKPFSYTRLYTHAQARSIQRGVSLDMMNDAKSNALKVTNVKYDSAGRPSIHYIGRKATVVVNPETGKTITTWKTSSKLVERLLK